MPLTDDLGFSKTPEPWPRSAFCFRLDLFHRRLCWPGALAATGTLLQNTIAETDQAEAFALLEQLDNNHPAEPHWYLSMIGVDPAHQGNGYGSALLKHALERCDREDKLAYLESSSPTNISLYERHGFESVGTIQVGKSPTLFPMLRTPRRVTHRRNRSIQMILWTNRTS